MGGNKGEQTLADFVYCMQDELQAFKVRWLKNRVTVKLLQMNVLFLTTLPTLKACNSPYMQYYFKLSFALHSSEVIFSFLIKKSRQKSVEIETAIFYSLGIPKGRTLDHFFYASHIRHNFPLQTDTYISELVEIFLKLSMETVQVHVIIWTTLMQ